MQHIGYVVYVVGLLIAGMWTLGLRTYILRGSTPMSQTVNITMLFIVALVVVPSASLSPLHLLWMFPASWLVGMFSLVFPFSLLSVIGHLFIQLVCIGIDRDQILRDKARIEKITKPIKQEENRPITQTNELNDSKKEPEKVVQSMPLLTKKEDSHQQIVNCPNEEDDRAEDNRNTLLEYIVYRSAIETVPFSVAKKFLIFPHRTDSGTLRIVVDRAYDGKTLDWVKFLTGYGDMTVTYKAKSDILEAIHFHYPKDLQEEKSIPLGDPFCLITWKAILNVDYDYGWRNLLKESIQDKFEKYRVITFGQWLEATDLIRKYPDKIALLSVSGNVVRDSKITIRDIFATAKLFISDLPCIAYGALCDDTETQDTYISSWHDVEAISKAISEKLIF